MGRDRLELVDAVRRKPVVRPALAGGEGAAVALKPIEDDLGIAGRRPWRGIEQ
jgi:hypothetical protein